jgi:pseudouridine kinase
MVTFVMNEIENGILAAIRANPMASQQELANTMGMSRESMAGYIMRLTRKGVILGKGYILPEGNNVLVIGGANVDLTGTSADTYRSGDSNPGNVQQSAGGVGRNIAENLARLGSNVSMITLVGNDNRGSFLIDHARDAGIQTQDFVQLANHSTSSYLALNNVNGELVGAVADMSIIDQLLPSVLAEKISRLQAANLLIVEANLPIETISWFSEQSFNAPIVADAVSATKAVRLIPLLPKLSLLKVNKSEAKAILGLVEDEEATETDLVNALLKRGVSSVMLSLGERGVMFGNHEINMTFDVPPCNMISDTGAGDALLAGYVYAQQKFERPDTQLKFAMACAASTLEAKHAVNTELTEHAVSTQFESYIHHNNQVSAIAETEN